MGGAASVASSYDPVNLSRIEATAMVKDLIIGDVRSGLTSAQQPRPVDPARLKWQLPPDVGWCACWNHVIFVFSLCIYAAAASAPTWEHVKCEFPSGLPSAAFEANVAVVPLGKARSHRLSDKLDV